MVKPIYVLAGQSNAQAIKDNLRLVLEQEHGFDGFVLVETYAAGAPLTYKRSKSDWVEDDELRSAMVTDTQAALLANPDAYIEKILWIQGEADTYHIARPHEYADRFAALVQQFRDELQALNPSRDTGVEKAQVVVSGLSNHAPEAPNRENWNGIISAQQAISAQDPLIGFMDPDTLAQAAGIDSVAMFQDGLHYSQSFRDVLAAALVDADNDVAKEPKTPEVLGTNHADVIVGTSGGERMVGGPGDDTYYVNHSGDCVVELSGEGIDTVFSSKDFTLRFHSQDLENLKLTGSADLNGTGNGMDNRILGNQGNNILKGAWGDDILIGGKGADTFFDNVGRNRMIGGQGDDVYHITSDGNNIVELPGNGTDLVRASISVDLTDYSANLENLTLVGTGPIHGLGNAADNVITGNDARNVINARGGDDVLFGNGGRDTLRGHHGNDILEGGAGRDRFVFRPNDGSDTVLDFEPGTDLLDFAGEASLDELVITQQGQDTVITHGNQDELRLLNTFAEDLSETDFVFG